MARGYDSPTAALAAIVECLDGMCDRVHVGTLGGGATLPCCPGCLLRVEAAGLRVADGMPRSLILVTKCRELILDVQITYSECLQVMTKSGASRSVEELSADGTGLVLSWWMALNKLACCAPLNQSVRFASITAAPPEGGCVSWSMLVEVDISLCGCP